MNNAEMPEEIRRMSVALQKVAEEAYGCAREEAEIRDSQHTIISEFRCKIEQRRSQIERWA